MDVAHCARASGTHLRLEGMRQGYTLDRMSVPNIICSTFTLDLTHTKTSMLYRATASVFYLTAQNEVSGYNAIKCCIYSVNKWTLDIKCPFTVRFVVKIHTLSNHLSACLPSALSKV